MTTALRPLPLWLFALASLAPLGLFALGLSRGGIWAAAALIYMTGLAAALDQIKGLFIGDAEEGAEFPAADALLVAVALGSLALLPCVTWAVAGASGLSLAARAGMFLAAGLWLGQVANPCAHELIHRTDRRLYRLGVLVYSTLMFGHHASAHRLVHHVHAATPDDPNSARSGEGFYAFALRAWIGSFRQGYLAETRRLGAGRLHPYISYFALAAASLLAGFWIAGLPGMLVWAGLAAHAQMQLLLSDYVQHYGLTRQRLPNGRTEPMAERHSWNAPHWFSAAVMLNAPRHSDHHAHPARAYPALRLPGPADAPHLPWPLPMACTIALFPPVWKRAIRPHLLPWRSQPPEPL